MALLKHVNQSIGGDLFFGFIGGIALLTVGGLVVGLLIQMVEHWGWWTIAVIAAIGPALVFVVLLGHLIRRLFELDW